jgi:adenosylcobinamide-GDP ribazoletransferase
MQSLAVAFKYLTIWGRIAHKSPRGDTIGTAAVYFPAVGLCLGLLLALLNSALSLYLAPQLLSIFLVGVLLLATGATHLDGLKNTLDGLWASRVDAADSGKSSAASIAVILLILLKISALDVIDDKLALSLLLTPALARWSLVIFVFGYHERCDEDARRLAEQLRFWQLLVITIAVLGLAASLLGKKGLWIALCLSVVALIGRSLLHRRHAVLTHDSFGALIEVSETLSLILLASL